MKLILALLIAAALGLWARSRRPSEVVPPWTANGWRDLERVDSV